DTEALRMVDISNAMTVRAGSGRTRQYLAAKAPWTDNGQSILLDRVTPSCSLAQECHSGHLQTETNSPEPIVSAVCFADHSPFGKCRSYQCMRYEVLAFDVRVSAYRKRSRGGG